MSKFLFSVLMIALSTLFVAFEALADGDRIVMQVRTTNIPGVEFDTIRTDTYTDGFATLIQTDIHAVDTARDYAAGVRVAEILLGPGFDSGFYVGRTSLRLGGAIILEFPWRIRFAHGHPHLRSWAFFGADIFRVSDNFPTTRVITLLMISDFELIDQVNKVATLEEDNDASSSISSGDVLRYTIPFYASHALGTGSVLRDTPDPNSPLIPGSVTTTHGTVFRGNLPSDSDVEIRFGSVPAEDNVSVSFLVRVSCIRPEIANQGFLTLRLAGSTFEYDRVTDDPSTLQPEDPTVSSVECGQGDPLPGPGLGEAFPKGNPQFATSGLTVQGDDLGTEVGPPLFTMNGITVQTEIFPSTKDQEEVVSVNLTPEMTAKAGVIPFTLTPADPQLPDVLGFVEIRPALETPKEIGTTFGKSMSGHIGLELAEGLAAFEAARAQAQMDPASCKVVKAELAADLQFANDLGVSQIIGAGETAYLQAIAANATQQQLDDITKAVADGVTLQEKMMQELLKNAGEKLQKGSKGKGSKGRGSRGKRHGLICAE